MDQLDLFLGDLLEAEARDDAKALESRDKAVRLVAIPKLPRVADVLEIFVDKFSGPITHSVARRGSVKKE